jgi:glyoxylase-like metal-dependent hydrolase (beta-lactamase superfamily II)
MRNLLVLAATIAAVACRASAVTQGTPADPASAAIAAQRAWWRAFTVADTAALAAHSAPGLTLTLSSGRTLDRATTFTESASFTTGTRLSLEWSGETVRPLAGGRSVAVSARMTEIDGRTVNVFRYLTVLERADHGAWRVAMAQSTREVGPAARVSREVAGPLDGYAGRYRVPSGAAITIAVEDSALRFTEPSGATLRLEAIGPGVFESTRLSASNGIVRFAFARDASGRVTALSRVIASGIMTFPRIAELAGAAPDHEVYAVRYGTLSRFPVAGLVAGADTARRMDIALMVWLVRAPGRTILVDAGFYRDKFVARWKPAGYSQPSAALARAGVRPEDVTDIVVSHVHWDHLDGADLFPNARLWIQREEYERYVDAAGRARERTIDSADAAMLARLRRAGRVELVAGDSVEILPGVRVFTGGKHTFASQYATVSTAGGPIVLASDNAYLYENLERRRPIAQTLDSASNLAAQARMLRLAGSVRHVVPGHDPAVFERFPQPGDGVARIR